MFALLNDQPEELQIGRGSHLACVPLLPPILPSGRRKAFLLRS